MDWGRADYLLAEDDRRERDRIEGRPVWATGFGPVRWWMWPFLLVYLPFAVLYLLIGIATGLLRDR